MIAGSTQVRPWCERVQKKNPKSANQGWNRASTRSCGSLNGHNLGYFFFVAVYTEDRPSNNRPSNNPGSFLTVNGVWTQDCPALKILGLTRDSCMNGVLVVQLIYHCIRGCKYLKGNPCGRLSYKQIYLRYGLIEFNQHKGANCCSRWIWLPPCVTWWKFRS